MSSIPWNHVENKDFAVESLSFHLWLQRLHSIVLFRDCFTILHATESYTARLRQRKEQLYKKMQRKKTSTPSRSCWPGPMGTYCWSQHGSDTMGCVYSMGCTEQLTQTIVRTVYFLLCQMQWQLTLLGYKWGTGLLWKFYWGFFWCFLRVEFSFWVIKSVFESQQSKMAKTTYCSNSGLQDIL